MTEHDRHIDIAAETFLEAMAEARLELLRILTVAEIDAVIDRAKRARDEVA